jgi:hypothetical protein
VVDWDAALVIAERGDLPEILHTIELTNVQLAELAAYDRYLDEALELSYRDLAARGFRGHRKTIQNLAEMRIDLARLNDELSNTTKFFGEWYVARLYRNTAQRFHLEDWRRSIADKLRTLDSLYQVLKQDQINHYMIALEAMIVVLILIDIVLLLM